MCRGRFGKGGTTRWGGRDVPRQVREGGYDEISLGAVVGDVCRGRFGKGEDLPRGDSGVAVGA